MINVEYVPETIYIKDALDLLTKKRKRSNSTLQK